MGPYKNHEKTRMELFAKYLEYTRKELFNLNVKQSCNLTGCLEHEQSIFFFYYHQVEIVETYSFIPDPISKLHRRSFSDPSNFLS